MLQNCIKTQNFSFKLQGHKNITMINTLDALTKALWQSVL